MHFFSRAILSFSLSCKAWSPAVGPPCFKAIDAGTCQVACLCITLYLDHRRFSVNVTWRASCGSALPRLAPRLFRTVEQGAVGGVSLLPPVRVAQGAAAPRRHGQVGIRRNNYPHFTPTSTCCLSQGRFFSSLTFHRTQETSLNQGRRGLRGVSAATIPQASRFALGVTILFEYSYTPELSEPIL